MFPRPRYDHPGSWQGKGTEPFRSREWFLDQHSQAVMTVESDNKMQVGKVLSQVFSWERKGPCLNLFCGFREISSDPYMIDCAMGPSTVILGNSAPSSRREFKRVCGVHTFNTEIRVQFQSELSSRGVYCRWNSSISGSSFTLVILKDYLRADWTSWFLLYLIGIRSL